MCTPRFAAALLGLVSFAVAFAQTPAAAPFAWPEVTRESKPWTRWWWPGSAADPASLTRQLEQFAAAGIGGVEITPIYGATGYEARYVDFLSPRWLDLLAHTGREAQRLGLGVDMATGTGWPFGGPWVAEADALQRAVLRDGRLAGEPTRMKVKRAAPGGEGLVVDPYSPDALRRYLAPFGTAFADFPRGLVRGQFHDSFEYFQASWTAQLPEVFRALHGYDVQPFAAALLARTADGVTSVDRDTLARIKSDYRETLAQLHLDYLRTWIAWSHERGWLVRNQSHGAPANLLDLYGAVDIPETETFGSTPFPIPGLRRDRADIRTDSEQDLPESLVLRVAASAAHTMGKPRASSESATWLREHWKESLAHVKPELDRILADGINHIFYHGTVFSPTDAPWPGWLFYASTQFNPANPWWDDFAALNRYIGRVQSVLQAGKPDNDILLYWPFADVLDDPAGLMKMFGVHDVKWMTEQPVGAIARKLMERGYTFDYISDAQLKQTQVAPATLKEGRIKTVGGHYKAIVVPKTRRMPLETLQHLLGLAEKGGSVIFVDGLPDDVPGFGRLAERREKMRSLVAQWAIVMENRELETKLYLPKSSQPREIHGLNCMAVCNGTDRLLKLFETNPTLEVGREGAADHGISFIRRRTQDGYSYFLANLSAQPFSGWLRLGREASSVVILDPLDGSSGLGSRRNAFDSQGRRATETFLQLAPGQSLVLSTILNRDISGPAWPYRQPAGDAVPLAGTWSVTFQKGGPELPPAVTTARLQSWTDLGADNAAARRFAGTARYRLEFDAPATRADDWQLDLGDVRESARVRLNGREVATVWSLPFRVRVGEFLQPGRNVLEIDVTNLAANRIRDLDRRKVPWKIMREINFVNINYKPFDAADWPLTPSGLLGPVILVPMRVVTP